MSNKEVQIETGWNKELSLEFTKPYFTSIRQFLKKELGAKKIIYPPAKLIFNAFNLTPWDKVKVVVLGQDPYHNPGEAMGLSFSVPRGTKLPPSLKNILKEQKADLGIELPDHGDLSSWANQGVLLLNAMLTVEHKKAGSHKKIGWQLFTDAVIKTLSDRKENLVFLLWGNFAKGKKTLIDANKHLILESAHPSPLARNAFFGNHHFSKTNNYLQKHKISPINWQL